MKSSGVLILWFICIMKIDSLHHSAVALSRCGIAPQIVLNLYPRPWRKGLSRNQVKTSTFLHPMSDHCLKGSLTCMSGFRPQTPWSIPRPLRRLSRCRCFLQFGKWVEGSQNFCSFMLLYGFSIVCNVGTSKSPIHEILLLICSSIEVIWSNWGKERRNCSFYHSYAKR